MPESQEVTTVINRHVKPGQDQNYAAWFSMIVDAMKTFPGYGGTTVVIPEGPDRDMRIIIYRFADKATLDNWESSKARKELLSEVDKYSTQVYVKATGLEKWLKLPDVHSVVAPRSGRWQPSCF